MGQRSQCSRLRLLLLLSTAITVLPICRGQQESVQQQQQQQQQIGQPCSESSNCLHISGAFCNKTAALCQCNNIQPIADGSRCLPEVGVNESCQISAQCRPKLSHSICVQGRCLCLNRYDEHTYIDGVTTCISIGGARRVPVDPVMIGVLATLVLMFAIICVVLRLFSKARFRQNQTILNTANSRLANASFFKAPAIKPAIKQLRGAQRKNSATRSIESLRHADPSTVEIAIQQEGRRMSRTYPRAVASGGTQTPVGQMPAAGHTTADVEHNHILVEVDTHV